MSSDYAMKERNEKKMMLGYPSSGIILVDKPRGPSSHQVTAWVGNMMQTQVGHTGTLDPMVSGVLVVMLGKAVKLAPILLQSVKEYICLMRLHGDINSSHLESVLTEFTGRIYQRPPRKSAVKRNLRIRTIHDIQLLERDQRLALLRVRCDAGSYIRLLMHHIGLALGVGAHLVELRRIRSGSFREGDAHTLQEIRAAVELANDGEIEPLAALIRPLNAAIGGVPQVTIRDTAVGALCHGAALAVVGIVGYTRFKKGDTVGLLTQKGELVCLADALIDSEQLEVQKSGLAAVPRAVVMDRGLYPRRWRKRKDKNPLDKVTTGCEY